MTLYQLLSKTYFRVFMQELNQGHEYNRGFQTIDYRWSYSISSGDVRGVIQNALLTHQKMFNPKSAAFSGYPSVSLSPQGFFYTSSCEQADIIQTVYLLSCVRIKSTGTSKKINSPLLADLACGGWSLALAGLDSEGGIKRSIFWPEKRKSQ